jgi:hypothetical protein
MKLCNTRPGLCSKRRSLERRKFFKLAYVLDSSTIDGFKGQISIVYRLKFPSFVFFNVSSTGDPIPAE